MYIHNRTKIMSKDWCESALVDFLTIAWLKISTSTNIDEYKAMGVSGTWMSTDTGWCKPMQGPNKLRT